MVLVDTADDNSFIVKSKCHHGPKTPTCAQAAARHWALAQPLMVTKAMNNTDPGAEGP